MIKYNDDISLFPNANWFLIKDVVKKIEKEDKIREKKANTFSFFRLMTGIADYELFQKKMMKF